MTPAPRKHSGFTLVEISIVLVIIGLLLGGVLKGQAMIENAKAKALIGEFKGVWTMVNAYKDIYKATPGDDGLATQHNPAATLATGATTGNNQIDTGTWVGAATPDAANESSLFWNQVRLAGMATGLASSGQATNAAGGPLGITSNGARPSNPPGTIGVYFICAGAVPGKLARAVDIALDDQIATSGNVFAVAETGGPVITPVTPTVNYVDTSFYTVCLAI